MNHQKINLGQSLVTPLLPFMDYNQDYDSNIFLKPENLQPFGSYKVRGIESVFQNTPIEKLCQGIRAASAGNMGQAIAFMANEANIPCTIYVPENTPNIKKERIKKQGAQLISLPFEELWLYISNPPTDEDKGLFIHPIFTTLLQKGYQNIGQEILNDLPQIDALVVPIGIGGLAISMCDFFKRLKPDVAIYTCEPESAPSFKRALEHGGPIKINASRTFVDAIGTPEIIAEAYQQLAPVIEDSIVVELDHAKEAVKLLLDNNKLLCEGAAACSFAAATMLAETGKYKNIVSILTGGNLASEWYAVNL